MISQPRFKIGDIIVGKEFKMSSTIMLCVTSALWESGEGVWVYIGKSKDEISENDVIYSWRAQ